MKQNINNTLLFTLEYLPFKGGVANVYENIVKHWPSYAKASEGKNRDNIFVLADEGIGFIPAGRNPIPSRGNIIYKKLLKPHWLVSIFYLWRAIKKNKISTVIVGHILPLGTAAYFLQKFLKFDYVVILHGMDLAYALRIRRKKRLAEKILKNAKKVICMNSKVAEMARSIVDDGRVVVVNPGVDVRTTHNAQRITQLIEKYDLEGKKILLQVGRLVERKGVDKVLEVMKAITKEFSDLVYVVIGDGPELPSIKYQVLSIKNNVILITNANDEELQAWYEICDIFIMPAREIDGDFEGFGIVYLEANVHGKPVIAGNSGGVSDAVKNNVNGLLVDSENTAEIKNAIIKLYKDDDLRKKLGEQGREWAKKFEWGKQVKSIKYQVLGIK